MELRKLYVLLAMVLSTPAMAEQGRVELVWDRWGVPHVFATTDEEAMYGLGYATRNHLPTLMTTKVTSSSRGRPSAHCSPPSARCSQIAEGLCSATSAKSAFSSAW